MRQALAALILATPLVMAASGPATLDVNVTGVRGTGGALVACVFRDAAAFPICEKSKTAVRQRVPVTGSTMRVRFTGLAAGDYAVAVHHDADGDGKVKTNFIGMPSEGVGMSGNAGGMPSFTKSQIKVAPGSTTTVAMRYL